MPDLVDSCDLLITGGTVIDGTGAARRVADVAITGNRIVGVGDLGNCQAAERVNATGLMVTPGSSTRIRMTTGRY